MNNTRVDTWKPFPIPNWVVAIIVSSVTLYSIIFLMLAETNIYILIGMSSILGIIIVVFYGMGFLSVMGMMFMDYDSEIMIADDMKSEVVFQVANQISIS
uniref:Transmembrane protein n=1 Tax=Parastrongyloides trichosuri TaxID=131310 RepID=A0A0N4ZBZ6_PARTI